MNRLTYFFSTLFFAVFFAAVYPVTMTAMVQMSQGTGQTFFVVGIVLFVCGLALLFHCHFFQSIGLSRLISASF
jgi:hypothetical protein